MSKKVYKLFGPNWSYVGIPFEVGKTYILEGDLSVNNGFAASEQLSLFLPMVDLVEDEYHICEVELLGTIFKDNDLLIADSIRIVNELSNKEIDTYFKKHGIFIIPEYNKLTKKFENNFLNDLKKEKRIVSTTEILKDNYYNVS